MRLLSILDFVTSQLSLREQKPSIHLSCDSSPAYAAFGYHGVFNPCGLDGTHCPGAITGLDQNHRFAFAFHRLHHEICAALDHDMIMVQRQCRSLTGPERFHSRDLSQTIISDSNIPTLRSTISRDTEYPGGYQHITCPPGRNTHDNTATGNHPLVNLPSSRHT